MRDLYIEATWPSGHLERSIGAYQHDNSRSRTLEKSHGRFYSALAGRSSAAASSLARPCVVSLST